MWAVRARTGSSSSTVSTDAALVRAPARRDAEVPARALVCGTAVLVLLAAVAALAWLGDNPVAARAGGARAGERAWAWLFVAASAAATAAYVAGILLVRSAPAARLRTVFALAVAIQIAPVAAPLLLSTDAWTYWSYGRIGAVHDGNPYRDPPAAFPDDPSTRWVGADWRNATSLYGPAFTLASEPLAVAAGNSREVAGWAYKALGAVAVLAAAALAARLSRRPASALAFVGWNPLLAVHFGGGGHNDAWMAALVVGALALAASGRPRLAGAAWSVAAAVKWIPLVLLPLRLLEDRARGRRSVVAGLAGGAALVAAAATWRYGGAWLEAAAPAARTAARQTSYAVPHRLRQAGLPGWLAAGAPAAAFALVYVALARRALRGRARLGVAAGALLLATPYLAPWYAVWVVPLAAAEDDAAAQVLAVALCAYLLPQTVPL